jgi:serine/threonine protein kinase/tetratricopeptide (TPR) repeat protein
MTAQLARGALFANRFEIERIAGAGGMGTVYRAHDRSTGNPVALKVLQTSSSESSDIDRFVREARLLAELRHPGIVSYISHGQSAEGQPFLAMEWLEGIDLTQRLKRGPLSLADSYLLISRVAEALELAHQRGIVHRDINPNNLFLPGEDIARVKLLDFGIARRTALGQMVTRTGLVIGTPEYMAPEQVRGERNLTPAADVFALGCVLYRCLTGESAFHADQIAALLVRILFEEPAGLSQRRPEIPDAAAQLLRRMLHKDPAQRIANAGELLVELAGLGELAESTTEPKAPSATSLGFARSEQVLYSLVVASLFGAGDTGEVPALCAEPPPESQKEREMLTELRSLGVHADLLVGGLLVVTIPPSSSANDQASLAARVGLLIKERWPAAVVAVATGRGAAQSGATVGEVVDRATRLLHRRAEPLAGAGATGRPQSGVWMDELSARLLSSRFTVLPVDGQALLIGEEKDTDASRPLLGKPTPCVGRDAELGMLEGQLLSCIEDAEARAILVTAAPGIGKSRLRHEFLRRSESLASEHTMWLGRGDQMRSGLAYSLLGDAIRRLCGLTGSEAAPSAREKLAARVSQHLYGADADERERITAFVAELCGVPFPEEGSPMLGAARQDPRILRERIRRAFLDFVAAECAVSPVLLVLDDLQWGDPLSMSLLDDALRENKAAPLCVLGFARPDLHKTYPKLWHGRKLHEIQLKGLARKPCERLIQQMLGKVEPALLARIVEQSAGNALFLEELIRAAAEGKGDAQADTVVAMLQARIGRLEPGPRRALQAAAVFGQTFWRGGVATVLGVPPSAPEVGNWLAALVHAEVIEAHPATRLPDEKQYGFRHGLVRDAAYGLLTDQDRQTGHRLAAEFLITADLHEPAVIAEHHERGGERRRAAELYAHAAEQSLNNSDSQGALAQVERGLRCDPGDDALAILRSVEIAAWRRLNRFDRLYELIPAALPRLRAGTRAWSRTLSVAVLAATLGPPQWRARAPQLIQMLLGAEPEPDARVAYAEALAFMALALAAVAPKPQVQPILQRLQAVVALLNESNPTFERWFLWPCYHNVYQRDPTPYSALLGAEEGIGHARIAGDRLIQVSLSISPKALSWFELGDMEGAVRLLREIEKEAEQVDGFVLELARQTLARVLCETGETTQLEEAVRISNGALDKPGGASMFLGMAHHTLARVLLKRQQPAVEQAMQAYHALEAAPLLGVDAAATVTHALLAAGTPAAALPFVEKALAIITTFGGAGFAEVELRLAASEAFYAVGDRDRAHRELARTLHEIKLRAADITDPHWRNTYLSRNRGCIRARALAEQWCVIEAPAPP